MTVGNHFLTIVIIVTEINILPRVGTKDINRVALLQLEVVGKRFSVEPQDMSTVGYRLVVLPVVFTVLREAESQFSAFFQLGHHIMNNTFHNNLCAIIPAVFLCPAHPLRYGHNVGRIFVKRVQCLYRLRLSDISQRRTPADEFMRKHRRCFRSHCRTADGHSLSVYRIAVCIHENNLYISFRHIDTIRYRVPFRTNSQIAVYFFERLAPSFEYQAIIGSRRLRRRRSTTTKWHLLLAKWLVVCVHEHYFGFGIRLVGNNSYLFQDYRFF